VLNNNSKKIKIVQDKSIIFPVQVKKLDMKYFLTFFFIFLTVRAAGQNQVSIEPVLILNPEIYQIISIEKKEEVPLLELLHFCDEFGMELHEEEGHLFMAKIYPSSLGLERNTLEIKNKLSLQTGILVKSIQSYGREYLPGKYVWATRLRPKTPEKRQQPSELN